MSFEQPEPGPADCDGEVHPAALRGFKLFNAGDYWHAHEALEEAWLAEQGEIRHLYRGILQVAVTYYHICRANYAGALKVYARSQRWLLPFTDECRGIQVGQLRADLDATMVMVKRLGPEHLAEFEQELLRPLVWR